MWGRFAFAAPIAAAALWSSALLADEPSASTEKDRCAEAYQSAQLHRRAGELIAARADLRVCGAVTCSDLVRADCVTWLDQVEADIPSVVLEARTDAGAVVDAAAALDGVPLTDPIDGRPHEMNPGLHLFSFRRAGLPDIDERVILRSGERNRLVVADWTTPRLPKATGTTVVDRPVPASVFVTAATAVASLADFAIAGAIGNQDKSALEAKSCAPFCPREKVDAMRSAYVVADVGLGVGVFALATSAYLFFSRPVRVRDALASTPVVRSGWAASVDSSGATVSWRVAF